MARIQALALPIRPDGARPFVLIVDRVAGCSPEELADLTAALPALRDQCGAKAVVVYDGKLDVA
ncbi:hypothetical protein [Kitasatospora sp. NPDC090091]|uniref:hypothetical protein n=1 Tax=Kitasatospora sp. NPDC090091 TaxID=3364081 RepID=UPI0037F947F5